MIAPSPHPSAKLPILVFIGFMGSGKTTLADAWAARNSGWVAINFADAVRKAINVIYGIPVAEQKLASAKKHRYPALGGCTLRHALQAIGTEVCRYINPTTWVDAWGRTYDKLRHKPRHERPVGVLVEDCRFINEFEMLCAQPESLFVLILNEPIEAEWRGKIEQAERPWNKFKTLVLRAAPWLARLGLTAVTVHQSELEVQHLWYAAAALDPRRVIVVNNTNHAPEVLEANMLKIAERLALYENEKG